MTAAGRDRTGARAVRNKVRSRCTTTATQRASSQGYPAYGGVCARDLERHRARHRGRLQDDTFNRGGEGHGGEGEDEDGGDDAGHHGASGAVELALGWNVEVLDEDVLAYRDGRD